VITEQARNGNSSEPLTGKPTAIRAHLEAAVPVAVAAAVIGAFYLSLYVVKHYPLAIGWDTPRYLFHANLVAARGLSGIPASLPPPSKTLHARPGFAMVVLPLSKLFATSAFHVAAVVPAVAAIAVGLAAAAFLSFTLRHDPLRLAVVAVIVGLSSVVIRLLAPETYTDNLFAAALFLAAFVLIVAAVRDGRGMLAAIVLLGVGGIVHPPTYGEILALLALVGLMYLPSSWRAWRKEGRPVLSTPTGRLGLIVAGGAAITATAIYGLLRATPDTPLLTRAEARKKLREDVSLYWFPVTVPVAAAGLAGLSRSAFGTDQRDRSTARLVLAILCAWSAVIAVGVATFFLGRNTPAHRLLAFLLPLPMLFALGLFALDGVVQRALRRWPWRRLAAGAVVVVGVVTVAALGAWDLYVNLPRRGVEWLQVGKVEDAATAAQYLDRTRVPASAPVVFVIDDSGPNPLSYVPEMAYMIRSVLPASRVEHAYIYVGDPARYLAGQPTLRPSPPTYNGNVRRFWPTIQRLLPEHPVALLLAGYNPAYPTFVANHSELVVAPDVAVLSGPRPPALLPAAPDPYPFRHAYEIALLGVGTFVVVFLIGLGWAIALLPRGVRSFEAVALAPAFGVAAIAVGALITSPLGLRLRTLGAVGLLAAMAVLGAFAAWWRVRRPAESAPARS